MTNIPDRIAVKDHFEKIAGQYDFWKEKNRYYYDNIINFVKSNIHPSSRTLEVGCGTGEILASTEPSLGVGIDISQEMINIASNKFPNLKFICTPIEDFKMNEKFDYIILGDVIDHVYDIMDIFKSLEKFCHPTTKIIMTTINPWWDPLLSLMEKCNQKMPEGPHNFVEISTIKTILEHLNFSVSYSGFLLLFPKYIPLLSYLANTVGVRTWGLRRLSSAQYMIIQPTVENSIDLNLGCSVIIPCYNEQENIQEAISRVPHMGTGTEIIVVNDGSTDQTAQRVKEIQQKFNNLKFIDYVPNRGKGFAVKTGFDAATQDIIMVLDADLSVSPEELPRFFDPLNKGLCQFVNGSRMVYPMEKQAMRFLNLLGNKIFSQMMTFIINQRVTDTLCGTKALFKKDYKHMKMGMDKWGDFDLLFGAAKMGSKIMEVPVHYRERLSGESKMKTLRHGLHLLKACFKGFKDLVMIPLYIQKKF